MEDIIVIIIVAVIVVFAGLYIYKAKKSGKKCIGCPDAENCGKKNASSCGGHCSSCQGCKND